MQERLARTSGTHLAAMANILVATLQDTMHGQAGGIQMVFEAENEELNTCSDSSVQKWLLCDLVALAKWCAPKSQIEAEVNQSTTGDSKKAICIYVAVESICVAQTIWPKLYDSNCSRSLTII